MAGRGRKSFHVRGRVVDSRTGQGIGGLRIEAWDRDLVCNDLVGSAVTDAQGAFLMEFDQSYFEELFLDRNPDLFFKVFQDNKLIISTGDSVIWDLKLGEKEITIEVDAQNHAGPEPPRSFVVKGEIRSDDGTPVAGVTVRAFDKCLSGKTNLHGEKQLGVDTVTDASGQYRIAYNAGQLSRPGKNWINLFIRVYAPGESGRVIAASPVFFRAGPEDTIDLEIGGEEFRGRSEYEKLIKELAPVLQDIQTSNLTREDITVLAGETGMERQRIEFLAAGAKMAETTGLPAEVFYGLTRQNLTTSLSALLEQSPQLQRSALETALRDNIIPARLWSDLDTISNRLQQLRVELALGETGKIEKTSLSKLLDTTLTPISRELRETLLHTHLQHPGSVEDVWRELEKKPEFSREMVDDLRFTVQLGTLTQNHLPLVRQLQQMRQAGALRSPLDLARLTEEDWAGIIHKQADGDWIGCPPGTPGKDDTEKTRNYARSIVETIEDAFPTAVVADRAGREDLPGNENLVRFFDNSLFNNNQSSDCPRFDFNTTNIDCYLSDYAEVVLAGVSGPKELGKQLKNMQRVFKIAPRYSEMRVLLADGLHSARSIVNMGQSNFVRLYGDALGSPGQATQIYNKAEHISAMSMTLLTKYGANFNSVAPYVIPKLPKPTEDEIPDWPTLFGSLDFCDCQHCRSVYSPAAYLVDLLEFLKNKSHKINGKTAKDILFKRRGEIGRIELSCENTNVPVPYVDLVNEVLENAVAPPASPPSLQTRGTPDELRVSPEYINDNAYSILAAEVYPWNLPFDRPLEAARTFLEHLGVKRHELLETFQKPGNPSSPNDLAIAAEFLGLTAVEQQIITNPSPVNPWKLWGYQNGAKWLSELTGVRVFLYRSGLSCQELNDLLDTRFINPDPANPTVSIKPKTSCQIDQMALKVKPSNFEATLIRIHRFVRLWRKLGWEMSELDKTLTALQSADLTELLLCQLSQIQRLKAELNLSLDQLVSLWSTIDTHGENSLYKKLFQNKAVIPPDDGPAFKLIGDGSQLADTNAKLSEYIPTILAALRISAADLDLILADANLASVDAALTLEHLSILYRYKVLAKALQLKVKDLIALRNLSGVNPFSDFVPQAPNPPGQCFINRDPGRTQRFVEIVQKVQLSGFPVNHLNYIYRHISEPPGSIAPRKEAVESLTKNIQDGLKKIAEDTALSSDPTGEATGGKLATVLEAAVADRVVRTINCSETFTSPLGTLPAFSLPGNITYDVNTKILSLAGTLSLSERNILLCLSGDGNYQKAIDDIFQKSQKGETPEAELSQLPSLSLPVTGQYIIMYDHNIKRLSFSGSMTPAEKALLLDLSPAPAYQAAVKDIFQQPRQLLEDTFAAFMAKPDISDTIAKLLDGQPPSPNEQPLTTEGKFNYILALLLSHLREKLSHSLVKQILSENLQLDYAIIQLLLDSFLKASTDPAKPAIVDFMALVGNGLTGLYFNNADFSGSPVLKRIDPTVSFSWGQDPPDPAINQTGFSVRWTGKLLAQYDEPYTFYLSSDLKLQLCKNGKPVFINNNTADLKAGCLYDIRIEYVRKGKEEAVAEIRWSSPSTPKQIIPQSQLYSSSTFTFDLPLASYYWLHKISLLVKGFDMTAGELDHLAGHPDHFALPDPADPAVLIAFWIKLPLQPLDQSQSGFSVTLFNQWLGLYDLFTLRNSLPKGEVGLIDVFGAASLDDLKQKLTQAAGWDVQAVNGLIDTVFGLKLADLRNEIQLVRLQACIRLADRLGASVEQLFNWVTSAPDPSQAKEIRQIVKAKYDYDQWLAVVRLLQDTLREKQSTALVSYLLVHPELVGKSSLKDAGELYEHFLIDVEMGACQLTSRIKQAISSIQLFVQRCLIGLEKAAALTEEAAKEWQWMKNYRVWEANRKVFLYPENWIEPDLRDDKSPFFKELESDLLQKALSQDSVETAFLSYLDKLDGVANLEVCGMYHQLEFTREGQIETNYLHVFGRTKNGQNHVYYYRRLVDATFFSPGYWTPWEKVDLDIEGDHLIPVVYQRMLQLFWPIFTPKADEPATLPKTLEESQKPAKYWEIKLARSEYRNGKWSAKTVTPEAIRSAKDFDENGRKNFTFLPVVLPEQLIILCFENPQEIPEPTIITGGEFPSVTEPYVETWIGSFNFSGCKGKVTPYDLKQYFTGQYFLGITMEPSDPDNLPLIRSFYKLLLKTPYRSNYENMAFVESSDDKSADSLAFRDYNCYFLSNYIHTLGITPGQFRLLFSYQYGLPEFNLDEWLNSLNQKYPGLVPPRQAIMPFFYQDDTRNFFVAPLLVQERVNQLPEQVTVTLDDRPSGSKELVHLNSINDYAVQFVDDSVVHTNFNISGHGYLPTSNYQSYKLKYRFQTFYHPYVCEFIKQINRYGIEGLLNPHDPTFLLRRQLLFFNRRYLDDKEAITAFKSSYDPDSSVVNRPYPMDIVNFWFNGSYSLYNWELFFHAPLLIADRLMKNQRFEEAQKWFHYIFDPTAGSDPVVDSKLAEIAQEFFNAILKGIGFSESQDAGLKRFWKIQPFFLNLFEKVSIQQLMDLLADTENTDPIRNRIREVLEIQVAQWRKDPFKPHRIAQIRISAYQKTVVMKYLNNLIAWGDQLFRQDTMESINQAAQLYILAAHILGPRPQSIKPKVKVPVKTYNQLEPSLDDFSNALVQIENRLYTTKKKAPVHYQPHTPHVSLPQLLYFCVPKNDKLLEYWDTVADRLFKIRHCMNIEGVVRELPLFEPPIDPALLVQAAAKGISLGSVLSDINTSALSFRFTYILQKALDLCAELKSLGGALLSTLEKKEAEALSGLRARHETEILKLVEMIKEQQYNEATASIESLEATRRVSVTRYLHYQRLLGVENPQIPEKNAEIAEYTPSASAKLENTEGVKLISQEKADLDASQEAADLQSKAAAWERNANISYYVPEVSIMNSPLGEGVSVSFGGKHIAPALLAYAGNLKRQSAEKSFDASKSLKLAGYVHREREWALQNNLAAKEIMQIDKQIVATAIRQDITKKEWDNHKEQIARAQEIEEFLRSKYTNEELYGWMQGEVSSVYSQCYQMAYDLAKKAEKAYRFEHGLTTSNFIQFGYWEDFRKGLMSGERLYLSLRQMDQAYLEQNKRDYEITKNISLLLNDPMVLITLKETGCCEVFLPESLFDADYPGHYMRRIKSVSLTIPCVTGPYTGINCTLTLLSNKTRVKSTPADPYLEKDGEEDDRFVANFAAMQSIATSHAQNDSGMFELNFRDERYLPFEGAGAISRWRIDLPKDCNAFDFNTLSDVILHLKYTAKEGGEVLRGAARKAARAVIEDADNAPLTRLFSISHEFHGEWHRFLHPNGDDEHKLELNLTQERFPFLFRGRQIKITKVELFLVFKDIYDFEIDNGKKGTPLEAYQSSSPLKLHLTLPGDPPVSGSTDLQSAPSFMDGLPHGIIDLIEPQGLGNWLLEVKDADIDNISGSLWKLSSNHNRLKADVIEDIYIVCHYTV